MLTLEERYNRKRTPIVSRPELVMAPLVEPEVAGSQNPVAEKVVAPVTPVNYSQGMDSVPPIGDSGKEGDTPPKLSDFHFFKDFTDKYSETPITQEEEEKRKRARICCYRYWTYRQCAILVKQYPIRRRSPFPKDTYGSRSRYSEIRGSDSRQKTAIRRR